MGKVNYDDLREYIDEGGKIEKCKVIENADWELEIGVIYEQQAGIEDSPLLIFDKVKGYPKGYRVVANFIHTPRRFALMTGLPLEATGVQMVQEWRKKMKGGIK